MAGLKPKQTNDKAYTKRALLKAYVQYKDLLGAVLEDDKTYTKAEVDKRIKDFMKG